jgi:predicted esterase
MAGTGGIAGTDATAGVGAAGMEEPPVAGTGAPPSIGSKSPTTPPVPGQCPTFRSGTIMLGNRTITLEVGTKPAGPTAPMVFYWHGTGSRAGEFLSMATAVHRGVLAEGGVLVSFQGASGTGDSLSGTSIFGRNDLTLADQLVACAVRDHNIDPRRIFTTGCSAGGLFATAMAALRSNYVAAAAPNSGGSTFPQTFQSAYTPALMTMHGAPGVDVVGVDFSNTSRTADDAFKRRGGFVINCNHGGRHCGAAALAPSVWEFFKAHPYGVEPYPWTGGLPAGFHSSCMIY